MQCAKYLKSLFENHQLKCGLFDTNCCMKAVKKGVQSHSFFENHLNYELPIKLVIDSFCAQTKKSFPLSQLIMLPAIFYCILFGMKDYGLGTLGALLKMTNVELVKSVLDYVCSERFVDSTISAWSKAYDEHFVVNELIQPFKRWREEIASYRQEFLTRLSGAHDRGKPTSTVTKPFNLTQPKARAIPVPELIIEKRNSYEVPASTHSEPTEFRLLEEAKLRNRDSAEKLRLCSEMKQPNCARCRPKHLSEYQSHSDTTSILKPASSAKKVLDQGRETVQVNLNTATILREWKLYSDAEKNIRKKLTELEAGALDNFPYEQWKAEQKNAKFRQQLISEAERRLTSLLSHEAALDAVCKAQAVRRSKVEIARKESRRLSKEIMQLQEEKRLQARQQAQRVINSRHLAHEAVVAVYQKKKKCVKNLIDSSQKQNKMLRRELEKDRAEKRNLVKRVRAAESAWLLEKSMGPRPVDLSSTPGHGLLGEMSVVEMKERLAWMKQIEEATRRDKRKKIIVNRQESAESVAHLLESIIRHRTARSLALIEKRIRVAQLIPSQSDAVTSSPKVIVLRRLFEEKKMNRRNTVDKHQKNGSVYLNDHKGSHGNGNVQTETSVS